MTNDVPCDLWLQPGGLVRAWRWEGDEDGTLVALREAVAIASEWLRPERLSIGRADVRPNGLFVAARSYEIVPADAPLALDAQGRFPVSVASSDAIAHRRVLPAGGDGDGAWTAVVPSFRFVPVRVEPAPAIAGLRSVWLWPDADEGTGFSVRGAGLGELVLQIDDGEVFQGDARPYRGATRQAWADARQLLLDEVDGRLASVGFVPTAAGAR